MLFLQYGINDHQELIGITQVPRGKTALHCPYCNGLLIARKGEKIAHYFAHAKTTCRAAKRDFSDLSLPVYDHFNLNLPGEAVAQLRAWAEWRDWVAAKDNSPAPEQSVRVDEDYLRNYEVLKWNDYKGHYGGWEITKKGKLILVLQPPLEEQERVDEQARDVSVAGTDSGHAFGVSPVPPAQMKSAVSGWGRKTNIEQASQFSQAEE